MKMTTNTTKSATDEDIMSLISSGVELLEDLLPPTDYEFPTHQEDKEPAIVHKDVVAIKEKRNLPRNRMRGDPQATLNQYRNRIVTERSDEDWQSLADAWLSDYGLYTEDACPNHHAHVIIDIAKIKGVFVKGVCAENKKNGVYVHSILPDGSERSASNVVYIGGYNRFTNQDSSMWAIRPVDKVVF